jgi:hypothetical protein
MSVSHPGASPENERNKIVLDTPDKKSDKIKIMGGIK